MITEEQKERRRSFIGSSDAAAILGVNPWRTPRDVWLEKTGQIEDTPENEAMVLGRLIEGSIAEYLKERRGVELETNVEVCAEGEPVGANIDGIDEAGNIWEIKTAGLHGSGAILAEYGDPDTDQVPGMHIVQVHHQMAALEVVKGQRVDTAYIAALLPRRGVVTYTIPRNDEMAAICRDRAREFWGKYVEPRVEPDGAVNLWALETRKRIEGKVVEIPNEVLERYLDAQAMRRNAEEAMRKAKADLLEALGDAEIGRCEIGEVSYKMVNRKEYVCKASSYRTLRIRTGGTL